MLIKIGEIEKSIPDKVMFFIQFALITAGFSSLLKISSEYLDGKVYLEDFSNYYVSYLLCFGFGIASLVYNSVRNKNVTLEGRTKKAVYGFAVLFALMITCANYELRSLYAPEYAGRLFRNLYKLLYLLPIFLGSGCASYNFLRCISSLFYLWQPYTGERSKSLKVFLTVFSLVTVVDLLILFLCKYPGNLQADSFAQLYQATGDFEYSNHHPFYHTMIIKACIQAGLAISGKYNAAVALYSCFQIVFMAGCFAYGILLLYEIKVPGWILVTTVLCYALAPYHIMYSFTMTKDVMYGGFVLVAVTSLFRYMRRIGNNTVNLLVTVISGLGICLFRSNGLFVYVLWIISILCVYGKRSIKENTDVKRVIIFMAAVVAAALIMKHPVLKILNVSQTDFVESLSIPIQQIGRTVSDHNDLTEAESGMLSKVLDIEKIREYYYHTSADPLKEHIRAEGNEEYLIEHKADYLRLYINIGLKHPGSYIAAWIDQSYGFWNAGYKDWHWYDWVDAKIYDNRYDIHRTVISGKLNDIFNEYLWLFEEVPVLQLFLCMGLHMWLDLVLLYVAFIRRDKEGMTAAFPLVWTLLSLMVATPLSMEFRYFYSAFCLLPVITVLVLRSDERSRFD